MFRALRIVGLFQVMRVGNIELALSVELEHFIESEALLDR